MLWVKSRFLDQNYNSFPENVMELKVCVIF